MDQTKRLGGSTVRYLTASDRSRFTVRAFATGLLSALGHSPTIAIPDFEGEALVNPKALEKSSLRVLIQAASLVVTDDISDKDRQEINRKMHEEVLECDNIRKSCMRAPLRLPARRAKDSTGWLSTESCRYTGSGAVIRCRLG